MKFPFFSKKNTLRFDSILIVTYGRTGSTLLQGILNSIDGVVIRGENRNFCYHLFKSWKAVHEAKKQTGLHPHNPFYGVEELDEALMLKRFEELIKAMLLGKSRQNQQAICYGFKEIRYLNDIENLPAYLDFLQLVFPNVCFVFNTRNKRDVLKSWKNVEWGDGDNQKALALLEKFEAVFYDYMARLPERTFHITYEDVIGEKIKLQALYDFIGAPYKENAINLTLSKQHSYKPTQEWVKKKRK